VRFLFQNSSQEKTIILRGQEAFQKQEGKSRKELLAASLLYGALQVDRPKYILNSRSANDIYIDFYYPIKYDVRRYLIF